VKYFDIEALYKKIDRYYERGEIFKGYIEQNDIFPIQIALKNIQEKDIQNNFSTILKDIQSLKKSNIPVLYKEFNFKSLGKQVLPVKIQIENLEEYLHITKKSAQYGEFVAHYKNLLALYPELRDYICKKPFLILEYLRDWENFFRIIDFFLNNPSPNIYIREISLKDIDTKYIEKHKKILDILLSNILHIEVLSSISEYAFEKKYNLKHPLAQVRFRILDDDLRVSGLEDVTLTVDALKTLDIKCSKVFIVENKITFLSFPKMKESIVIFGHGYGVAMLKEVIWLEKKNILYWGDIDIDGFAILSQLRGYFSNALSLFMDQNTMDTFKSKAILYTTATKKHPILKNLTAAEMGVYKNIECNFRLEQERIPFDYIKQYLTNMQ